ncbi:hypothetical protein Ancab_014763 [Ancistrocladus abbreviatus]
MEIKCMFFGVNTVIPGLSFLKLSDEVDTCCRWCYIVRSVGTRMVNMTWGLSTYRRGFRVECLSVQALFSITAWTVKVGPAELLVVYALHRDYEHIKYDSLTPL